MNNQRKNIDLAIQIGSAKLVQKNLSDSFYNPLDTDNGVNGGMKEDAQNAFNNSVVDIGYQKQFSNDEPTPAGNETAKNNPLGDNVMPFKKNSGTAFD